MMVDYGGVGASTAAHENTKFSKSAYADLACVEFASTTTFHGIPKFEQAKTWKARLFWAVVFAFCLIIFLYQFYEMITRYLRRDKIISIRMELDDLNFPAVTFCNLNPIKKSAIYQSAAVTSTLNIYNKATAIANHNAAQNLQSAPKATPPSRLRRTGDKKIRINKSWCRCEYAQSNCKKSENNSLTIQSNQKRCWCDSDRCFLATSWTRSPCKCYGRYYYLCDVGGDDECGCSKHTDDHGVTCYPKAKFSDTVFDSMSREPLTVTSIPTTTRTTWFPAYSDTVLLTREEKVLLKREGYSGLNNKLAIQAKAQENLRWTMASLPADVLQNMSYSQEDQILQCSYGGDDCEVNRDFALNPDKAYGNCFTFNSNVSNVKQSYRPGALYGLRFLLLSNVSEYIETTISSGIKLVIHHQQEHAFPDTYGLNAPTGFMSSFAMKYKRVRNMPHPYGNCRDHGFMGASELDKYYLYGDYYTLEGCYRSCMQHAYTAKCGCGDPRFPLLFDDHYCTQHNASARNCLKNMSKTIEKKHKFCECPPICNYSVYETTFSTSRWPTEAGALSVCPPEIPNCVEMFREQALFVEVYFSEQNVEFLEENPAYGFVNIVSDFGGQLGLWLGCSVITGFEVIAVLYRLITCGCCREAKTEEMLGGTHGDAVNHNEDMYTNVVEMTNNGKNDSNYNRQYV